MATQPEFPASGERREGTLTSDLPLLRGWEWPYVAISGKTEGPRATIIAGIHGCEYVSIRAAVRLGRELDPAEVRGQVLVVPIVNLPSYWERSPFVTPYDGKNLNRVFPGKVNGTFSDQLAYFIFNTVIKPSDAFIDLHGGDMVEDLLPFTGYAANAAPEVSAKARAMAEAFGLPFAIGRTGDPTSPAGMTYIQASHAGVAGLLAEAGGIGQLTLDDVDVLVDGTRRALQVAGNLPGEPESPGTTHVETSTTVFAQHDGFWICEVQKGEKVRRWQTIGRILTLLGDEIEEVKAPQDGTILYRTTSSAMKQNGILVSIVA
jgi:predicted deacylase